MLHEHGPGHEANLSGAFENSGEAVGFPRVVAFCSAFSRLFEKQASGRQPRRVAIWKAQHIGRYVSIYKSHATQDHGLRRRFSTAC
jgi:hypothetical protein